MPALIHKNVAVNRGSPRVWLEGIKLEREGYAIGSRYNFKACKTGFKIEPSNDGLFQVSRKKKRNADAYLPLIDICKKELLQVFFVGESLRITITKQKIRIQKTLSNRGFLSLLDKVFSAQPIALASLYHGGGVLDRAVHDGLKRAGISSFNAITIEREPKFLDSSLANNDCLFNDDSIVINSDIERVNFHSSQQAVDGLLAGIPCTDHSISGKAKKNNLSIGKGGFAENGSSGAQVFYLCQAIACLAPSFCIFECTTGFSSSASAAILRTFLADQHYHFYETIFNGNDFGVLEGRKRWVMVAIKNDMAFSFPDAKPHNLQFSEIADRVADDALCWKTYDYLDKKEAKDLAAGKGFKRQYISGDSSSIPTITKDYMKVRSTDPQVKHPFIDGVTRLLTTSEHAKAKGVPVSLVANNSDTVKHQILGQGVVFPFFELLAKNLGTAFLQGE